MTLSKAIEVLRSELVCRPLGDQELLEAIAVAVEHLEKEL